jgi:hypothetical protein
VNRRRPPDDEIRAQIAAELYTALERLSADPELLAVVGSWRDTLDDDEILEHLKSFNRTGKVLHRPQRMSPGRTRPGCVKASAGTSAVQEPQRIQGTFELTPDPPICSRQFRRLPANNAHLLTPRPKP